jgi:hypothetical protein
MAQNEYAQTIMSKIYSLMVYTERAYTTRQISLDLGIAWVTAKKNLETLYNDGIIQKSSFKNRTYWRARKLDGSTS